MQILQSEPKFDCSPLQQEANFSRLGPKIFFYKSIKKKSDDSTNQAFSSTKFQP
jgi:hypothetical protein